MDISAALWALWLGKDFTLFYVVIIMYGSSSSALFFIQINFNVVTMVGLTNDERCLIYNLRVAKHWGSKKILKMFFE